jgi:hypothetical protein
MLRRLKASLAIIIGLAQLLPLLSCTKSRSTDVVPGLPGKVTGWVAYQLPLIPIKFVFDSDGNLSIKAEASIPTPLGTVSFGAGYTPTLVAERYWSEATTAVPTPVGDLDVIIRDTVKNEGRVYSISANDQGLVAVVDGTLNLLIKHRQIIITITGGEITTDITGGQVSSLWILPAPVLGDFVLDEAPISRHAGSLPAKLSNCQNPSQSLISFPGIDSDPSEVPVNSNVEWELEGTQSKGTGTYFNGGKLPIETDLAPLLDEHQSTQHESSARIRWTVPLEANSEADCLLKWWEVWRTGHIDVFVLERKVATIRISYFDNVNYSYEITSKRNCAVVRAAPPPVSGPSGELSPPPERTAPPSFPMNGLISSAQRGSKSDIESWLSRGAPVNGIDAKGQTALMAAAENGHSDAAKLLLERGANVNARDNRGRVALMEAVAAGHDDTVKLLLRWNADVNAVDASGMTSLGESRRRNYTQITHLLQNAGAWR